MDKGYKNFECTICYDIFLYPVCLPCSHRFCKLCLDKHLENNNMCCPICRFRVSNWLRQLRRSNADIVDKNFWDTVQKLYPKEIEKRINGHIDYHSNLIYFRKRLATFDDKEKRRSASLHKAFLDLRYLQDQEDDWLGWPEPVFQVCREILQCAKDDPINETPPTVDDTPKKRIAKPGEIHEEYKQFLQQELEEKRREDEKNFRLSEAMIRLIEEDERREEEKRVNQLLKDEELARRLAEEAAAGRNLNEERLGIPKTPRRRKRGSQKSPQENTDLCLPPECRTPPRRPHRLICPTPSTSQEIQQSPICINTSTPSASTRCFQSPVCINTSTPSASTRCFQSPICVGTQSTSKENVFAKFYSKTSSISNEELSHFTPVQPGPSNLANASTNKKKKEAVPSSSRCSSGCDSIGQELNHFKPIRSSPTTPPKEGGKGPVPKVVVAQRGIGVPDLNILPLSPLDLLAAEVSLEELETSINLEKQLEEDRKLAMEIQNQLNGEMKMPAKADYNLRKRKRPPGNTKKKVFLDRNQTTLDNLLIK